MGLCTGVAHTRFTDHVPFKARQIMVIDGSAIKNTIMEKSSCFICFLIHH